MNQKNADIRNTSGFACKRMNAFHVFFKNGIGISTIFGAMTYSSNRSKTFPIESPGEPAMEAEEVEIMILGNVSEEGAKKVLSVIGEKNSSESYSGPYSNVTVDEWMGVANILKNL